MSLSAQQLACTRGARTLFRGLDLHVGPGEALQVAGANGSGKTSLLRILCGLGHASEGKVRWKGGDIREEREQFCSQMIYLGHAGAVKDDLLAWENVVIASTLAGHPLERERACLALERLGLGRAARLPARVLSQGQRKRVALARLQFGMNKPLWILDEPFAALDSAAIGALCNIIDEHLAQGGSLVYTTHQDVPLHAHRLRRLDLDADRALPC